MNPARSSQSAWDRLAASPTEEPPAFEVASTERLPAPARRFLLQALPPGTPLCSTVVLEMEGDIRIGRKWMPFHARQVIRAGHGFVWIARVGKRLITIKGADSLVGHDAGLDFRLWGLVPVARASGPDVAHSAAGRLAIETALWLPQALAPQVGGQWVAGDDTHATALVPADDGTQDIRLSIDADGKPVEATMRRWGDPDGGPFAHHRFGGDVDNVATFDGVTIAASGRAGWWWGTPRHTDGEFFGYRITRAVYEPPAS